MFTLLYSSCSDDYDVPPGCGEADRGCEGDQTDDNVSVLQSQCRMICHLMMGSTCHLFTYSFNVGKMSRGGWWGVVTRGKERVSGYRKEDSDKAFLDIKISTRAISYISMGMPAHEPIIKSILGKKSDLQNRNFSNLVWGAWSSLNCRLANTSG